MLFSRVQYKASVHVLSFRGGQTLWTLIFERVARLEVQVKGERAQRKQTTHLKVTIPNLFIAKS